MLTDINKSLQIQILQHTGVKNGKVIKGARLFKIQVIKVKTPFYISYYTQSTP